MTLSSFSFIEFKRKKKYETIELFKILFWKHKTQNYTHAINLLVMNVLTKGERNTNWNDPFIRPVSVCAYRVNRNGNAVAAVAEPVATATSKIFGLFVGNWVLCNRTCRMHTDTWYLYSGLQFLSLLSPSRSFTLYLSLSLIVFAIDVLLPVSLLFFTLRILLAAWWALIASAGQAVDAALVWTYDVVRTHARQREESITPRKKGNTSNGHSMREHTGNRKAVEWQLVGIVRLYARTQADRMAYYNMHGFML